MLTNNLKALENYRRKRVFFNHLPSYLWIEPTNHCNLNCIMCPIGSGKIHVKRGFMNIALFKKIIDEVHPHTSAIILAIGGESLLHKDIFEMISYAQEHQVKVSLNTNATLLDRDHAEKLLKSGISYISFAFDGFNKNMYEKARRGAEFERTLENIIGFLRIKKERRLKKPYTVLSMLELEVGEFTQEEKTGFIKKFENLIDKIHFREANSWGNLLKDTQDFTYKRFEGECFPCGRLWNTLGITWNGDVIPCTYNMNHDYVVGNIFDTSLSDIWNSAKLIELRQAMLYGNYLELSPLCENCTVAGTPKILGVPAGLRATISDAASNFLGYGFEQKAIRLANTFRKGKFAARHIR